MWSISRLVDKRHWLASRRSHSLIFFSRPLSDGRSNLITGSGFKILTIVPNLEPLSSKKSWSPTTRTKACTLDTLMSAIFISLSTLRPIRNSFAGQYSRLPRLLYLGFYFGSLLLKSNTWMTFAGALFSDSSIMYCLWDGKSTLRILNIMNFILSSKDWLQSSHFNDFQKKL